LGTLSLGMLLGAFLVGRAVTGPDSYNCGSVFSSKADSIDAYAQTLSNSTPDLNGLTRSTAEQVAQNCCTAVSDRAPYVYGGFAIGSLMLVGVGLAEGIARHFRAIDSAADEENARRIETARSLDA
jgi:hypothetical protein